MVYNTCLLHVPLLFAAMLENEIKLFKNNMFYVDWEWEGQKITDSEYIVDLWPP